jgi:hypothetical protein
VLTGFPTWLVRTFSALLFLPQLSGYTTKLSNTLSLLRAKERDKAMEFLVIPLLIASYVGVAMFLAQFLYAHYVRNDPEFKGRLPMGIRFSGNFTVNYKYGYRSAYLLGVCSMLLVAVLLLFFPEVQSLTIAELIRNSWWRLMATLVLVLFSHFLATSTTKLAFNLSTVGMMWLSLYASIAEANFEFLVQSIIAFAAFMGALGVGWFMFFQAPRLRKFEDRRDYRNWVLNPVEYFWGTYAWNVGAGGIVAILVYGLSH